MSKKMQLFVPDWSNFALFLRNFCFDKTLLKSFKSSRFRANSIDLDWIFVKVSQNIVKTIMGWLHGPSPALSNNLKGIPIPCYLCLINRARNSARIHFHRDSPLEDFARKFFANFANRFCEVSRIRMRVFVSYSLHRIYLDSPLEDFARIQIDSVKWVGYEYSHSFTFTFLTTFIVYECKRIQRFSLRFSSGRFEQISTPWTCWMTVKVYSQWRLTGY